MTEVLATERVAAVDRTELDLTERPSPAAPERRAVRLLVPAGIFALSRLPVLLAAQAVTWFRPDHSVTQLLGAWDGGWYLRIAEQGYPADLLPEPGDIGNRWAFYPAVPWATRAVSEVTRLSPAVSGILVATVCGLVAAVAIWLVVEDRLGSRTALATTALICFFPTSYVMSMVYTESMFLAVAALCLLATQRRAWAWAGALASLGCLVRTTGVVLVAMVVVTALVAMRRDRSWRPVAGVVVAPIGLATWSVVQWVAVGSPTASYTAQQLWHPDFIWFSAPFRSLWHLVTDRGAWSDAADVTATAALLLIVASAVIAIIAVRSGRVEVPIEWWIYSAGVVVLAFSPYWSSSILRYAMLAFPLYAVALHLLPRWLSMATVAVGATALGTISMSAFLGVTQWQIAPFAP